MTLESTDVLIVGAGPAGSVAAGFLRQQGRRVLVLERELFPRFSIGESLLPQSMEYIQAAGMLQDVVEAGFQHKNGAAFAWGDKYTAFDFRDKFSEGWGTTYQVQRATFDKVLADAAVRMGAEIRFQHEVTAIALDGDKPRVSARDAVRLSGAWRDLHARGRPHPAGRLVRSPEDPRDGAPEASRRVVLDDPF